MDIDLDTLSDPWRDYARWCVESPEDETPAERWQEFFRAHSALGEEHLINCRRLQEAMHTPDEVSAALDVLDNLPDQVWLWPRSGLALAGLDRAQAVHLLFSSRYCG
ncbi:MAG: hypothetical protein ACYTEQ_28535 [Planctomycetota bacterium]|jgi:hypothetical protein